MYEKTISNIMAKIAEQKTRKANTGYNVGVALGANAASGAVSGAVGLAVKHNVLDKPVPANTMVNKHVAIGAKAHGLALTEGPQPLLGPHILPGHHIAVPKGSPAAFGLHELGHAENYAMRYGKYIPHIRQAGMGIAGLAGIGAMVSDKDSKVSKYAPAVAAAGFAPMLADEAGASLRALRTAKKLGIKGTELSAMKGQLGKAFSTYGTMAALGVGIPYAIHNLKKPSTEVIK